MSDALLLVDLISRFDHADGERLLASLRRRLGGVEAAIGHARAAGVALVYANDNFGRWDSDAPGLVRAALDGPGGDVVERLTPVDGDRFVVKPRYSAFDHTPLSILLGELGVDRVILAGTATEGCVVQTAIDARELGFKVTIVEDACATNDERLERVALEYAADVGGCRLIEAAELPRHLRD
ncbi:MAG TPA: isochorismatase family cysteine hydrolase [Gaiellaceae bacterium]|nr:isochorismatase family cysteine hydrolase [Gaiellaceae bacterium]